MLVTILLFVSAYVFTYLISKKCLCSDLLKNGNLNVLLHNKHAKDKLQSLTLLTFHISSSARKLNCAININTFKP